MTIDNLETKQMSKTEDKIDTVTRARLDFMDHFFREENEFNIASIIPHSKSPRSYDIVNFKSPGGFDVLRIMPDPIEYRDSLEVYLSYLYSLNVRDYVKCIENIAWEEMQTLLKAIYIHQENVAKNSFKYRSIRCVDYMKREGYHTDNMLCWNTSAVLPWLDFRYFGALRTEMLMKDNVPEQNLEDLYLYFKENPNPGMKVLRLEDSSSKI